MQIQSNLQCGDFQGKLLSLETLNTLDLPRIAGNRGEVRDPWLLLRFGDSVLAWMRSACQAAAGQHVRFAYDPARGTIGSLVLSDGDLPIRLRHRMQAAE
jgi:hypothetical protein